MSTRVLSVLLVALVAAIIMLVGFYWQWPPVVALGFFVGIGAAVALGVTVARKD